MPTPIGLRIGAILKGDKTSVHLIGFGVYQGDEVPPKDTGGMGSMLHEVGCSNPKLIMDDGQVTWGCECWWGPEEQVRKRIEGLEIIPVNISEERSRLSVG